MRSSCSRRCSSDPVRRNDALSANDVFTNSATPFDALLLASRTRSCGARRLGPLDDWYPDGTFGLLEAAAYVGLPVLALAALGLRAPVRVPIVLGWSASRSP